MTAPLKTKGGTNAGDSTTRDNSENVPLDATERRRLAINASNRRSYASRRANYPGADAYRKAVWRRQNPEMYQGELKRNRERAAAKRAGV